MVLRFRKRKPVTEKSTSSSFVFRESAAVEVRQQGGERMGSGGSDKSLWDDPERRPHVTAVRV